MSKRRIFIDMDGTLAKRQNVENFRQFYKQGYYRNLKQNEEIVDEVNKLIKQGEDIYIFSEYLTDSKYAKDEKQHWIKEYFPNLQQDKQIFVPYGTNKAKYLKETCLQITNNEYLISDNIKNLEEWKTEGGIGVRYNNEIKDSKDTWQGLKIYDERLYSGNRNTNLFNFILSEKLKENGISMLAMYDGFGPDDMSYKCIYDNKYYDICRAFWNIENPEGLSINKIADTIQKTVNKIIENNYWQVIPEEREKAPKEDLNRYYARHYPTLLKCYEFDKLITELDSNTLDNMEYTLYLYLETDCVEINKETNEFIFNINKENCSRVSPDFVLWYEGNISTDDLLSNKLSNIEEDLEEDLEP